MLELSCKIEDSSVCLVYTRCTVDDFRRCVHGACQVPGRDTAQWNIVSKRSTEIRLETSGQHRRYFQKQVYLVSTGASSLCILLHGSV